LVAGKDGLGKNTGRTGIDVSEDGTGICTEQIDPKISCGAAVDLSGNDARAVFGGAARWEYRLPD
jgi:hypothetical protein